MPLPGWAVSERFADLPDFFAWPLPGPFKRDERVPGSGTRLRPELDQVLHLKAGASQQPDHIAVTEVELHGLIVWPLEPVHAEVRPRSRPVAG
jgi:hypothetical protein